MSLVDRRALLRLAGVTTLSAAMSGAVRAEGGLLHILGDSAQSVPFAHRTPVRIGQAALRVRQLEPMVAFYRDSIGLDILDKTSHKAVMGVDGVPLLDLDAVPDAAIEDARQAGLYHIAFLMPTRRDLAEWLVHATFTKLPLTGFADHAVSEAVYLDDPEGNGLEVYADRPADTWRWSEGSVFMTTDELDVDGIVALTDTSRDGFKAAPKGLRIGHVHLRVGDIEAGRGFYQTVLGLQPTRAREGAAFLSSGGYHHHVAINTWQSAGAGPRTGGVTGLDWFSLVLARPELRRAQVQRLDAAKLAYEEIGSGLQTADPWGTKVRLVSA